MFRILRSLCGLLVLVVLLAGCGRLGPPGPQQPLVVGLPPDPVFQQVAPTSEGMDGYSRDLAGLFAKSLGVGVRFVVAADYPALLRMLHDGKVHLAATLPVTGSDATLIYSPPLRESRQVIVQHVDGLPVDSPEKLAGREISVLPGAPQIETLRALKTEPPLQIVERPGMDELELLARIARRPHELAASDELHYTVAANYDPDLEIALELSEKLSYVWAFTAAEPALRDKSAAFIDAVRADGTLRRLNDRYFGHIRRLDANDIATFLENARTRLVDFRAAFHEAQEITGVDWRLLAALAYQESKWDPLATSPTGVRGLMMLTEDTADRLGVTNRLDAMQSIRAGAKYLAYLMDELPPEIKQPDRLWFALAAYNLGMGHLNGARHFAPSLKRDPNSWVDMKQVLPLMSRPEYYERLKSGRARGGEAVIMVENIRNYFDVLTRLERIYTPPSLEKPKPIRKPKAKRKKASAPRA